jgi:hypothetical protein
MALKELVIKNKQIFWDIAESALPDLSKKAIVERIVNYGDMDSFRNMVGSIEKEELERYIAEEESNKRKNYRPEALNFFKNYLKYH